MSSNLKLGVNSSKEDIINELDPDRVQCHYCQEYYDQSVIHEVQIEYNHGSMHRFICEECLDTNRHKLLPRKDLARANKVIIDDNILKNRYGATGKIHGHNSSIRKSIKSKN